MTRGGEKLRQHDDRPRELEWFGPLVLSMKTAERNIHCLSRMDVPAFQHKKKGPPFSRGPFPFYEALRAPAHPGSKPGIRSDSLRGVTPGGQNLTWLLLLGFLRRFLLHVLFSFGLDLVVFLPGFFFIGIGYLLCVSCCRTSSKLFWRSVRQHSCIIETCYVSINRCARNF